MGHCCTELEHKFPREFRRKGERFPRVQFSTGRWHEFSETDPILTRFLYLFDSSVKLVKMGDELKCQSPDIST